MAKPHRSAVTATQRVYRLKLFLLETSGSFTLRDIRSAITDYQGESGSASRSKKLERDLELIAQSGWQLSPDGFREIENGREQLYRLQVGESLLQLQDADGEPVFNGKQLALLRVAAESLHSTAYHDDALEILMRITAAQERFEIPQQSLPIALERQHISATARAAYRAMRQQKRFAFCYYAPKYRERAGAASAGGGETCDGDMPTAAAGQQKQISVWRIESIEGKLFIIGFDHEIAQPRTYLLDRITEHRQLNLKAKPVDDRLLQSAKHAFWQHRQKQTVALLIDQNQPGAKTLLALPEAVVTASIEQPATAYQTPLTDVSVTAESAGLVADSATKPADSRVLHLTLKTHDLRLLAEKLVQNSEAVLEIRTESLRKAVAELLSEVIHQHRSSLQNPEVLAQLQRERKTDLRGAAGALTQQQKTQLAESLLFMRPQAYPLAELAKALGLYDMNSNLTDIKAVCEVLESSYNVRVMITGDAEELSIDVLESAAADRFYGFNRRHTTVLSYPLQRLGELLSGEWLAEYLELLNRLEITDTVYSAAQNADPVATVTADTAATTATQRTNLQILFNALLVGQTVRFSYQNIAGVSGEHRGLPVRIFADNDGWVLRLWSAVKQRFASYRCQAINGVVFLDSTVFEADPDAVTAAGKAAQLPEIPSETQHQDRERLGQTVAVVAAPAMEWTLNSRGVNYLVARAAGNSVGLVKLFDYEGAAVTLIKRAPGQVWLPELPKAAEIAYSHGLDPAEQDRWRLSVLCWALALQRRLAS